MAGAHALWPVVLGLAAGCGARSGLTIDALADEPPAPVADAGPPDAPLSDAGPPGASSCTPRPDPEFLGVAAAEGSSCAIRRDHSVWCWGRHAYGVLAGLPGDGARPVEVPALAGAKAIACGVGGCCVVRVDGHVVCAGASPYEGGKDAQPQGQIPGIDGATAIAVAPHFGGCALSGAGIVCFRQRCVSKPAAQCTLETHVLEGSLGARELGSPGWFIASDGSARHFSFMGGAAFTVAGFAGASHIAASINHACAAFPEGRRRCVGHNGYGELGPVPEPIVSAHAPEPVEEPPVEGGAELFFGEYMSCQRTGTGDLLCWGENDFGQLGHEPRKPLDDVREPFPDAIPTRVEGLRCVRSAAAGRKHACALTDDGVFCWGRNLDGELGDGTTSQRATPAPVVW